MASRDGVIQKTFGAVINAYFGGVTAQALVNDKGEEEGVARDTLLSAQHREAQGRGAQSDTLQATAALAKISLDKNRAVGTFDKALADLGYLLGVAPNTPIALPQNLDQATSAEAQDLHAWLVETERSHPDIVVARAALDAAREQVNEARSGGRPTLDLTANYYQNGYPYQGLTNTNTGQTTIGITITVPVFDGFATHYKVAGAQALVKEKEAELADAERSTLMGVMDAYADAQSSLRNPRASEDLLGAAQAAFQSSQRRYANGAAEITELLAAQATWADAKGERVRCLADWHAARLMLLTNAGQLNRAAVQD
jgi:outer membrane protein